MEELGFSRNSLRFFQYSFSYLVINTAAKYSAIIFGYLKILMYIDKKYAEHCELLQQDWTPWHCAAVRPDSPST